MITKRLTLTLRQLLMLFALSSSGILGGALFGQYVLRWAPCDLCIYQRYPYVAIFLVAALALWLRRYERGVAWFCVAAFVVTAAIAFYHSGVEMEWFAGPDSCSSTDSAGLTIEELRAQLLGAPLVSCKQAMAYVFGLSLAMWNMLIASGLAVAGTLLLREKS